MLLIAAKPKSWFGFAINCSCKLFLHVLCKLDLLWNNLLWSNSVPHSNFHFLQTLNNLVTNKVKIADGRILQLVLPNLQTFITPIPCLWQVFSLKLIQNMFLESGNLHEQSCGSVILSLDLLCHLPSILSPLSNASWTWWPEWGGAGGNHRTNTKALWKLKFAIRISWDALSKGESSFCPWTAALFWFYPIM